MATHNRPAPLSWVAWQVSIATSAAQAEAEAQRQAAEQGRRFIPPNPKPPGQFCHGGAAEAVLGWLLQRRSATAWWSMTQLIGGTGRSAKACSWAVIYLHRLGYLERERDVANSRYLRYRASPAARDAFLQPGGQR